MRHEFGTLSSYMDFGFWDSAALVSPEDLIWMDVQNDPYYGQFWWHHYLQGVRIRPQTNDEVSYE
jgi:hypothetical protein